MDRLTERDEYGNANIIGVDSADLQLNLSFDEFNKVTDALNCLADYEDTEYANEQLRAKLKEANEQIEWDNDLVHELQAKLDKAIADLYNASSPYIDCCATCAKYPARNTVCEERDSKGRCVNWEWRGKKGEAVKWTSRLCRDTVI